MLAGLGLDLTEIPRIQRALDTFGERFQRRVFTDAERAFCLERAFPARHFAARFAAKEAALKALRVPKGLSWHEIEVVGGGNKVPSLQLSGRAHEAAVTLGVTELHLTISHTDDVAAAVVIALAGAPSL
jgi:holo-[acyl-carrier protein] synthase